jgi:2-(3-amino-3-carboxypropyl)histidine synthase
MTLDFEEENLIRELNKRKPKRVLVQLPEGIKNKVFDLSKKIEGLGIDVVFSGDTCWGGCSLALSEAKAVGADLIVHFGHAEFMKSDFPVIYVEVKDMLNLEPILKKSLKKLEKFKKIGLSYSIQHRHDAEKIIKFYESNKKTVSLSKKLGRVAYEGHIVGCQYSGLKAIQGNVDCFVVVGNRFHSLGAVLSVNKPVFLLDVYNDEVIEMGLAKDKIIKQRFASIERFKTSKNIGIIIEVKPGQNFGSPKILLEKFRQKGKNAVILLMNEVSIDKLTNFPNIDCFVELACPRIAVDDFAKYNKSILSYKEALVGLGEKSWEKFLEEGVI